MLSFEGKVSSGLQKAGQFMEKEVYKKQYLDKIGFIPYPGTLNIKLSNNITLNLDNLHDKLKRIHGNGSFGDVLFLEAYLSTIDEKITKKGAILGTIKIYEGEKLLETSIVYLEENIKYYPLELCLIILITLIILIIFILKNKKRKRRRRRK